jgi:hypothetical protein
VRTSLPLSGELFENEHLKVEYVWKAPWTIVKATFLPNRYANLIGQLIVALEEMGILSHGSQGISCMHYSIVFEAQSSTSSAGASTCSS